MKILSVILVLGLLYTASAGYNCVQAFCAKNIAECKNDETCQQHIAKCSNQFRKQVASAQKTGQYKGTEHALDDYNYCMRTNPITKAINACADQYCKQKNLIAMDIEIEQLQNLMF